MFTANKDSNFKDTKVLPSNLSNNDEGNSIDFNESANKAGRKVRDLYNAASKEIGDDIDIVTSQIRKKPVQSSMIALGAGFLLGALLRRV
jgi:ElaB/YqjD/DUF883 family membrane-anchored ribosome-binding protein